MHKPDVEACSAECEPVLGECGPRLSRSSACTNDVRLRVLVNMAVWAIGDKGIFQALDAERCLATNRGQVRILINSVGNPPYDETPMKSDADDEDDKRPEFASRLHVHLILDQAGAHVVARLYAASPTGDSRCLVISYRRCGGSATYASANHAYRSPREHRCEERLVIRDCQC